MIDCPKCTRKLQDSASTCQFCGAKLAPTAAAPRQVSYAPGAAKPVSKTGYRIALNIIAGLYTGDALYFFLTKDMLSKIHVIYNRWD